MAIIADIFSAKNILHRRIDPFFVMYVGRCKLSLLELRAILREIWEYRYTQQGKDFEN